MNRKESHSAHPSQALDVAERWSERVREICLSYPKGNDVLGRTLDFPGLEWRFHEFLAQVEELWTHLPTTEPFGARSPKWTVKIGTHADHDSLLAALKQTGCNLSDEGEAAFRRIELALSPAVVDVFEIGGSDFCRYSGGTLPAVTESIVRRVAYCLGFMPAPHEVAPQALLQFGYELKGVKDFFVGSELLDERYGSGLLFTIGYGGLGLPKEVDHQRWLTCADVTLHTRFHTDKSWLFCGPPRPM